MIYLIGGPPRCGKTIIAKQLASQLAVPWITADMLESIITGYIAEEDYSKMFPKNVIREKTNQSNDEMYAKYSAEEIVEAYIQQAQASWRAIEVIVDHASEYGENVVLEGHQIHPALIAKLASRSEGITSAIIIKLDVTTIIEGAKKNRAKNDWLLQKTKDDATFSKIANMIRTYGEYFQKEAKKYNIRIFTMDNEFDKKVNEVVAFLSA